MRLVFLLLLAVAFSWAEVQMGYVAVDSQDCCTYGNDDVVLKDPTMSLRGQITETSNRSRFKVGQNVVFRRTAFIRDPAGRNCICNGYVAEQDIINASTN